MNCLKERVSGLVRTLKTKLNSLIAEFEKVKAGKETDEKTEV
jgi:hypothetical protein